MQELILEWKRSAVRYRELGKKADHNPVRQEGLLCRSEVYDYCAAKLEERLQQGVEADACPDCGKPAKKKLLCSECGHGLIGTVSRTA